MQRRPIFVFVKRVAIFAIFVAVFTSAAPAASPPAPKDVLGMDVGADRVLASYSETVVYLKALAARSDRVRLIPMGETVEGRTMLAVAVSSPSNIARLDALREEWARIADPRGLTDDARRQLAATAPTCALVTAGIHGNEVAGPQSALKLIYELASAPGGSGQADRLDRVVVVVVPSLNPDGQDAVVAWYRKHLGTPYEGSNPPFLYHRYAGHDNNRDFVYLTQPESRALNRLAYHTLHPQLFIDLHQMGATGPRQFVPPFADPIAPNVHPLVWRTTSHLGTLMSLRLEEAGKSGVVSGWTFDGNWIGGTRNTGWWKNVFGVLTETASAALATPINVDPGELRGGGKGLVDYRAQVNFPNPWPGGTWGLSDAVGYQLVLLRAFVEFATVQRQTLLEDVATMATQAIRRGATAAPLAFVIPPGARDPGRRADLIRLLAEAGVEGFVASRGLLADGVSYPAGTVVFPAAQPLRQYLVEVTGRQHYPEIAPAPGAEILLPYDITAWTMPLCLGVEVVSVEKGWHGELTPLASSAATTATVVGGSGRVLVAPAGQLGAYALANRALAAGARVSCVNEQVRIPGGEILPGSFVIEGLSASAQSKALEGVVADVERAEEAPAGTAPLRPVRVGVYHPDFGLEDAGWCRFVLERASFPVDVVDNRSIASGVFAKTVQVLVFPPMEGKVIVEGVQRPGVAPAPPEFRKGIGKDGVEAIKKFFAAGGTVIAGGGAAQWLAEALDLPVTNALQGVKRDDFACPGALLDLEIAAGTPLGWGMPTHVAAMYEGAVALQTRPVSGEDSRVVAARFPDSPALLSGWIRGEDKLHRRAAVVEVRRGQGRAVLFAFPPFFRGQTEATFPLFYNAVLAAMMDRSRPAGGDPKDTNR